MRNDNLKTTDIIWNTLGTCSYAIVSLLLSIVIIKLSGKEVGGIFSFGFSTLARVSFIITFFGIRPMHIVDIKYNYSFKEYKKLGIRLAIVALLITLSYVMYRYFGGTYSKLKTLLLTILIIHGTLDGFSDYYECEYQRSNRLCMAGRSQFFRIITFALVLIVALLLSSDLFLAELFALVAEIIVFYALNIQLSKGVFKVEESKLSYKDLFIQALPLFMITFMDTLVFSMSKFFIDARLGDVYSGFYNIVFMPTNAIYLLMSLFMKPILTPLSYAYYNDKKEYSKILSTSLLIALAISLVSIAVSFFLGSFYLNTVYYMTGNSYPEFSRFASSVLVILMVGGSFYALCTPTYFALIIENRKIYILISYIISIIVSVSLTGYFVKNFGLMGAAYSFALSMLIVCLGISIVKVISLREHNGK